MLETVCARICSTVNLRNVRLHRVNLTPSGKVSQHVMGIEVVIVLLLIVANGLLSMSELAIVSARAAPPSRRHRLRRRSLAKRGTLPS